MYELESVGSGNSEFLSLPRNGNGTGSTAPPHGPVNDTERSGPLEALLAPSQSQDFLVSSPPQKCQLLICEAEWYLMHYNRPPREPISMNLFP